MKKAVTNFADFQKFFGADSKTSAKRNLSDGTVMRFQVVGTCGIDAASVEKAAERNGAKGRAKYGLINKSLGELSGAQSREFVGAILRGEIDVSESESESAD